MAESGVPYRVAEVAPHKPYTVAYEPEEFDEPRPRAIFWYRAYAAVMLVASLVCLAITTLTAWAHTKPEIAMLPGQAEAQSLVILLFLVSAAAVAFYGVATFMPLRAWAWSFGLLVLGLGCLNLSIVFCLPLLLAWLKPDVRVAFCEG